ncbi:metal-dependent hydrolase [Amantichitinum ursilacus]|uniref:Inner membrane protein YbcI n=1 Tax=Amantichitinum ursilacus TaxID=857265 RepID=A0A0N0GR53_9NEIS|nr:metal-dependent hydrolase [Amantichitinum ursilacus]KPC55351.1 Inner membrane protein YbcI [Amantichitinum ursilacus]
MPTIISHAAVPLTTGIALGRRIISRRLLLTGIAASMLPDADTAGLLFGIPFGTPYSHRGFTHSICFALVIALLALWAARKLHTTRLRAALFVFIATVSHPLLDMCTDGGSGVALFWPLSNERVFFPWQVIAVSPIGVSRVFTERFAHVLGSEAVWVWGPALVLGLVGWAVRRRLTLAKI